MAARLRIWCEVDKKLMLRYAVRETLGVLLTGLALFWPAGDLCWWPAWALIAVTTAWVIATGTAIVRHRPDLLAERLGPRKGAKRWDLTIMSLKAVLQIAVLVVAGLDHRYGWSGDIHPAAQVAGLIVCSFGYGLVVWATASNAYFSQLVRIQAEHGHSVVTGGPYRHVRHPAYAGGALVGISTPVLLGSWMALVPGTIDALLIILRTVLEDRTLQVELPGYREYARRVTHRLLPLGW